VLNKTYGSKNCAGLPTHWPLKRTYVSVIKKKIQVECMIHGGKKTKAYEENLKEGDHLIGAVWRIISESYIS